MQKEDPSCRVGIAFGSESNLYSFPNGHPLNNSRIEKFASTLSELRKANERLSIVKPVQCNQDDLLLFHTKEYVRFVESSSVTGTGYLDYGDTPSFKGVYQASLYTVGSSIEGFELILKGRYDHFFNPVGGLHHARKDRAGGFCVFNDAAIVIGKSLKVFRRIAYVDIDAHHGDGVFYGYEEDERVIIGDIHEDGRYLYPGTGYSREKGKGQAEGTKLNIPLAPSSGDIEFQKSFDQLILFISDFKPEFIFFQCGADGLSGDPLTHLCYSKESHAYSARALHSLAHKVCGGRILAMGGGGYNPNNVTLAWSAVVKELVTCPAL